MNFDISKARALLRAQREELIGSRSKLSKRTATKKGETPVSPQTIADIETGHGDPGIQTFARVVEALPGMTFSSFLLQIERQTNSDYSTSMQRSDTTLTSPQRVGAVGGKDGSGRFVPTDADSADELDSLVVDVGNRLLDAIRRRDSAREQVAAAGPARAKRAKNNRTPRR